MQNFMFPPKGFGPGSQVLDGEDEELDYVAMPSGMQTFEPKIPYVEDTETIKGTIGAMIELSRLAGVCNESGENQKYDFSHLDEFNAKTLGETMGEGEVSIMIETPRLDIQESVFTGLWRIADKGKETLEIGVIPTSVQNVPLKPLPAPPPMNDGVLNAPSLLTELVDNLEHWQKGDEKYVINLTLLPHSMEDLAYLESALGKGGVTILSRGYGNCRIERCAHPYIWWVRYYNSQDQLILDTIEITDIPDVAMAAPEDIQDTQKRLKDIAEAMQ